MQLRPLKHVGRKKVGTHDALYAHKKYCFESLLNLSMRMLKSIEVLFATDKRNFIQAMKNAFELQESVAWKLLQTSVRF